MAPTKPLLTIEFDSHRPGAGRGLRSLLKPVRHLGKKNQPEIPLGGGTKTQQWPGSTSQDFGGVEFEETLIGVRDFKKTQNLTHSFLKIQNLLKTRKFLIRTEGIYLALEWP